MSLHHGAAGRCRFLLVLSTERIAADLQFYGLQDLARFPLRRKYFARTPMMDLAIPGGNDLVKISDGREAENFPFVGLGQEKARQVINVNALHDDHTRT